MFDQPTLDKKPFAIKPEQSIQLVWQGLRAAEHVSRDQRFGQADPGELETLQQAGIAAINRAERRLRRATLTC